MTAPEMPGMDEAECEMINRRAAVTLRHARCLAPLCLPLELTAFHYSPLQAWKLNPWHMHAHTEILLIRQGYAQWRTAEREIRLPEGSILIVPGNTLHRREPIDDAAAICSVHLAFTGVNAPAFGQAVTDAARRAGHVFPADETLRGRYTQLTDLLRSGRGLCEEQAGLLLASLALDVLAACVPDLPGLMGEEILNRDETQVFQKQVYEQAVRLVQSNPSDTLTQEEIAKACHVSVRHLNRIFSAINEVPLKRFILQKRIGKAYRLLADHDLSIQHVATSLGFSDASHFVRTFQKECGLTPGAFRKRLAELADR